MSQQFVLGALTTNVHSENKQKCVITEILSWTQTVTNLLGLQNTTFQSCSLSKCSPIIPRLIFKASPFSVSPPTTSPRTSSNRVRERERQRWREHLNVAFREWSARCLETFHILFTPGRFQPGTAGSWQGLCMDTASLSLSLSPFHLLPRSLVHRSVSANLSTRPPSNQHPQTQSKQARVSLPATTKTQLTEETKSR